MYILNLPVTEIVSELDLLTPIIFVYCFVAFGITLDNSFIIIQDTRHFKPYIYLIWYPVHLSRMTNLT